MLEIITDKVFEEVKHFFNGDIQNFSPSSPEVMKSAARVSLEINRMQIMLACHNSTLLSYEKEPPFSSNRFNNRRDSLESELIEEAASSENVDIELTELYKELLFKPSSNAGSNITAEKLLSIFEELTRDDYNYPKEWEKLMEHLSALVLYYSFILPRLDNFSLSTHLKFTRSTAKLMAYAGMFLKSIEEKGAEKDRWVSQAFFSLPSALASFL